MRAWVETVRGIPKEVTILETLEEQITSYSFRTAVKGQITTNSINEYCLKPYAKNLQFEEWLIEIFKK